MRLHHFRHKITNVDLVYEEYGRVPLRNLSTRPHGGPPKMHRIRSSEGGAGRGMRPSRAPRLSFAASFAAVALIGSAVPAIASATSVITISGATASYPLVQLLAHKYTKLQHDKVSF